MQLMTDLVGRTLSGRYRLAARLSGGHLGDVYTAGDTLLSRPVAVKVLPHSLSVDESVADRFREEAKAAARLNHPNAVTVLDWGADAGTFYMVMEPIPTTDLRDLLVARGSLAPAQAAELIAQVCDALSAAHRAGLVHRSLKPENILIADGGAKVTDFAFASVAPREDPSSSGMTTTHRYISPEQALGFDASPTSDVWAAGAILCEMLTGRPPLQGAGADLIEKRSHEEPLAPSSFDSSIPGDLDDVVMKACALDPAARFHDASDMAHALRRAGARSLPEAPSIETLVEDISTEFEVVPSDAGPFVKERNPTGHGEPKLRLRFGRILVAMLVIAALVFGGFSAAEFLLAPVTIGVPDTVGLELSDARAEAADEGFGLQVDRVLDLEEPEGVVVGQTPAQGELEEGGTLQLMVSDGQPSIRVPSIEGTSAPLARARVRASGFEIGQVLTRHSSAVRRGDVLKQLPDKGQHDWGSKVHLVISKGPPPVEVPKLEKTLAVFAVKKLKKAGLDVKQTHVYSESVEAGLVISTKPAAGKTLKKGSKIEVVVSLGPELQRVTLPDLRNERVNAAVGELAGLGLQADVVESCKKAKRVVDTEPIAGTTVTENDVITLLVC